MTAIIINAAILIMEIISFVVILPKSTLKAFKFYTMLSNLFAGIASALFLVLGADSTLAIVLRYSVSCMLALTCIIAIGVLIPMGMSVREALWTECSLILHLLAPVMSVVSYIFFENKIPAGFILVPILLTLTYGITTLILVYNEKMTPPYPFLRVKEQSPQTTAMWIAIVLAMISLISFVIWKVS